jgi:hypothetical protein
MPIIAHYAHYCPLSVMPIAQDQKPKTKTNYDAVGFLLELLGRSLDTERGVRR